MKNNIKEILKSEFIIGQTWFDWAFLCFGILLQVFAIVYGFAIGSPDNTYSIISALTGIISVVLCAQGKISFYVFGYIQLLTYVFGVAIPNRLYGEIWENVFYFVTMVYGTYVWFKNYKTLETGKPIKIEGKVLTKKQSLNLVLTTIVGIAALALILTKTKDPVPFFDAVTTVSAVIAQILLMLGYREQWAGWIIEDIASIVMFIILKNWVMTAQYIFWTVNCIYGWIKWSVTDCDADVKNL